MNMPRFIPELDTTTPLQLREGELRITTTGFLESNRPLWVHLGPAAIMLTEQEAIDVGTALIQSVHHRRAVLAQFQEGGDAEAVQS